MGLIDEMVGALSGGREAQQAPLAQAVGALMQEGGPGLDGLLARLRETGHAAAIESWRAGGTAPPLGPEPIRVALGDQEVRRLAGLSALSPHELTAKLGEHLPGLVRLVAQRATEA